MASADIPLMIDAPMDVDMDVAVGNALDAMGHPMPANFDLFGDPLRPSAASKQLLQRLDELRASSCCQCVSLSLPRCARAAKFQVTKLSLAGASPGPGRVQ